MLQLVAQPNREFLSEVLNGLKKPQKEISPKWFYDERGSALFEEITRLDKYYPTRTETGILRARAKEIAQIFAGANAMLELGSGASVKTRILLDALEQLDLYIPQDISEDFLLDTSRQLAHSYPHLKVEPLIGDFLTDISLTPKMAAAEKILFFPGSTIGNFDPKQAEQLLRRLVKWENVDGFILGADLVKDEHVLIDAYDDAKGVTAEFNFNLLRRFNRECQPSFNLDNFEHEARWNSEKSRIEMHLVAKKQHTVSIAGEEIGFDHGETIHTENSHKFTQESLENLAQNAGWRIEHFWTDAQNWFSLSVLKRI